MRCEQHCPAVPVHPAGDGDADGTGLTLAPELAGDVDDSVYERRQTVMGSTNCALVADNARLVHHAGKDLGGAEVDTDRAGCRQVILPRAGTERQGRYVTAFLA